jgi:hypothetical protein
VNTTVIGPSCCNLMPPPDVPVVAKEELGVVPAHPASRAKQYDEFHSLRPARERPSPLADSQKDGCGEATTSSRRRTRRLRVGKPSRRRPRR